MELQLFNTLSRKKEKFTPLTPGQVGIYTCGPTVYAPAHIGNLRSYIFPDILKKTFQLQGYQVHHVVNITDVGHLTSDADTGEDKMERAARESERTAWEIAAEFTEMYMADLTRLNIEPAQDFPRATDHIPEQIKMIEELEKGGYTYASEDGVYFDTEKFPAYGKMAQLKAEGLQEGSRVDMGGKRNKTDFALWKFSTPGSRRQMEWESPWRKGFPGWHIECSAMSMKYLGETFDIHTGGTDHIPVHHTNEIAQSEAATGKPFVHYWLHGEYLVLGESKRMGKSEGNLVTLKTLELEGFEPLSFRYLALNSHYRSYLNFTREALKSAATALNGLRKLIHTAGGGNHTPQPAPPAPEGHSLELLGHLNDDLNTPKALATLWTVLKNPQISPEEKIQLSDFADRVLGLNLFDFAAPEASIPPEIQEQATARWQAKKEKDFALADQIRKDVEEKGYLIKDSAGGFEVEKKN